MKARVGEVPVGPRIVTLLVGALATLFLAQATNIDLSLTQELSLLAVAMLTSKGASGVTGAGLPPSGRGV